VLVSKNPELQTADGLSKSVQASTTSLTNHLLSCRCNDISVVTLLRDGKPHHCKDYCWDQLEWTSIADRTMASSSSKSKELYGSFQQHGQCKKQHELSLKHKKGASSANYVLRKKSKTAPLIPRQVSSSSSDYNHMPDYPSLIRNSLGAGPTKQNLLLMGDSVTRQAFEVLPMVLPGSKVTYQHYAYYTAAPDSSSPYTRDDVEIIKKCEMDYPKRSQKCWRNDTMRYACTCTTVSVLEWQNVTISLAWGYGIEFENKLGNKQTYGLAFNVVKAPLYNQLAKSATAIVAGVGVLPQHVEHKRIEYADMLHFFKKWIFRTNRAPSSSENDTNKKKKKLIYRLTMPQHFHTHNAHSTYQDEKLKRGNCVERATERHWSDVLAQETLLPKKNGAKEHEVIDLIDLFPIASNLGRFHSNNDGDCSQWCLGYDLFYTFWAAIGASISPSLQQQQQNVDYNESSFVAVVNNTVATASPASTPPKNATLQAHKNRTKAGKVFVMDPNVADSTP